MEAPKLENIEGKLSLVWTEQGKAEQFAIDYLSPEFKYRIQTSLNAKDLLIRAVGATKEKPLIWDFTMGLGMDMVQLAAWGCQLEAWERNSTIYSLVDDALSRLKKDPLGAEWASRIRLHSGESKRAGGSIRPNVVYLDPMYPQKGRSKPKKELRALRTLVGDDLDAPDLFLLALRHTKDKVVVKRPDKAELLVPSPLPHHTLSGTTVRFDIYTKN